MCGWMDGGSYRWTGARATRRVLGALGGIRPTMHRDAPNPLSRMPAGAPLCSGIPQLKTTACRIVQLSLPSSHRTHFSRQLCTHIRSQSFEQLLWLQSTGVLSAWMPALSPPIKPPSVSTGGVGAENENQKPAWQENRVREVRGDFRPFGGGHRTIRDAMPCSNVGHRTYR